MGSRTGKKRDFEVHFGVDLRLKTSSFWAFSKYLAFVFKKMVASLVAKNNLFPLLLSALAGGAIDFHRCADRTEPRTGSGARS
jgi:hypothetical protein